MDLGRGPAAEDGRSDLECGGPNRPGNRGGRQIVQDLIVQLAEEQDLVIIDRSAQGLFRDRPGTLHVQLIAPRKFRIAQVSAHEGLPERQARKLIRALEIERARYLRFLYQLNPSDPRLYDLILRMDRLSIEQALKLIETAVDEWDLRQVPGTG